LSDNDDFCVLVDLAGEVPEYFICTTGEVQRKLIEHREQWLVGKSTRDPNKPLLTIDRPLHDPWLRDFKDNWKVLETITLDPERPA
jgi:hypothetical protein